MLKHFKELKRRAVAFIALMSVAILLLYCAATLLLGIPLVSVWVIAPFLVIPVFGNLVFNKFESKAMAAVIGMVGLYENDCNPQAFVDKFDSVLDTFEPRFDINEVWVLSAYARALFEIGEEEKARVLLNAFREQVERSEHPEEKGPMMVNYEPLIFMLEGVDAALVVLDRAQKAIEEIPEVRKKQRKDGFLTAPELREDLLSSPDMQARLMYIEVERRFLSALKARDACTLEKEKRAAFEDGGTSNVLKARYAYALAEVYCENGDESKARKALEDTVRVAGGLRCAREAKKRMDEMPAKGSLRK